MAEENE
jgi:small subunit ribosomal protein S17